MKIIQIVINEKTLVALREDGTLWQLVANGSCWARLPDCRELTEDEGNRMLRTMGVAV